MTQINLTQLLKNAHSGDKKADIVEFALISVIASSVRSTMRAREVGGPDTVLDVDLRINGEECDFSYLVLSFARKLEDGRCLKNTIWERGDFIKSADGQAADQGPAPGISGQKILAAAELEVGEIEAGGDRAPAEGEGPGSQRLRPEQDASRKDGLQDLAGSRITAQA